MTLTFQGPAMDLESAKAAISFISAIIAALSALVAHRTRRLARNDIFEAAREACLVAIAETTLAGDILGVKTASARRDLNRVRSAYPTSSPEFIEARTLLGLLEPIEASAKLLATRPDRATEVRGMSFTEANIKRLRDWTGEELVLRKQAAIEAREPIFATIAAYIERNEPRRPDSRDEA